MAEVVDNTISQMTLVDWLDDLTVRFLLNLPAAELSSVPRLCFQVEEAQWFYEDFIRPANPTLPSLNLRQFLLTLFQHCPLLSGFDATQHVAAYEEFLSYKVRVPVRGAILMDHSMEKVLLVRGWKKGASWSFPRGKINKDEKDLDCAVREVYEETGYDISAAGLVKSNQQQDGQVKSIDVTMREQHMKLFVFRGVALDTYFEPKTRKEIGKIQWYNVRDLPGFKKQKGLPGQGQGQVQTSKFYMVAPFLGHLKKWIGQQRKNDTAQAHAHAQHTRSISASNNVPQTDITEDEGGTEPEFVTDNAAEVLTNTADELKRLLSIGGAAISAPAKQPPPEHAGAANPASNLLAMLRGSQASGIAGSLPHTPIEQIDPILPSRIPDAPQPQYLRLSSTGHQQQYSAPQHPYPPQHPQQPQQPLQGIFSVPAPNSLGPQHSNMSSPPPYMQYQFTHQRNGQPRTSSFVGQQFGHLGNAAMSSVNLYQQLQMPHLDVVQQPAHQYQTNNAPLASPMPAPNPFSGLSSTATSQARDKPLGSESSVPEPSKLPPPKLDAHSLRLLDTFKSTGASKTVAFASSEAANGQGTGNHQEATLLDLFRIPSITQSTTPAVTSDTSSTHAPASPALTDVTVKPQFSGGNARKPASDEITRSLPKGKASSPIVPAPPGQGMTHVQAPTSKQLQQHTQQKQSREPQSSEPIASALPVDATIERSKPHGQLYDPSKPQNYVRASSQTRKADEKTAAVQLQKPTARHTSPSPSLPPKAKPSAKITPLESANTVPQFSILQRPGSSTSKGPRSPVAQSPLRHESGTPPSQSHVLRRLTPKDNPVLQSGQQPETSSMSKPSDVKKDHLLSLFDKSPGAAKPTPPPSRNDAVVEPHQESQQKSVLLGLFADNAPVKSRTPEPPPAPQLLPTSRASSQGQRVGASQQTSQQHLLSLFSKPTFNAINSPGTPISPFNLNTPVLGRPHAMKQQEPMSEQASEPRSRLGSIASSINTPSNGSGQQTPTSATPTKEAKDFLLGYLNGVVQKEGHKAAKKH